MAMQIDHAGRNDQTTGIEGLRCISVFEITDFGNSTVLDADVGLVRRRQRAVNDGSTLYYLVELSHKSSCAAQPKLPFGTFRHMHSRDCQGQNRAPQSFQTGLEG